MLLFRLSGQSVTQFESIVLCSWLQLLKQIFLKISLLKMNENNAPSEIHNAPDLSPRLLVS